MLKGSDSRISSLSCTVLFNKVSVLESSKEILILLYHYYIVKDRSTQMLTEPKSIKGELKSLSGAA